MRYVIKCLMQINLSITAYCDDKALVHLFFLNRKYLLTSFCQEEDLFKWELTTYPEIEMLTTAIEPYLKLFSLVVKWQKSEKKWMDGAFLDLNAETIEAEVKQLLCILRTFTFFNYLRLVVTICY